MQGFFLCKKRATTIVLFVLLSLFIWIVLEKSSGAKKSSGALELMINAALLMSQPVDADEACGSGKVLLCHFPPGNPDNPQSICVAESSVADHLAHGDYLGACKPPTPTPTPTVESGVPTPTPGPGTPSPTPEAETPTPSPTPGNPQASFSKSADKRVLVPGESITYRLRYGNRGNVPLSKITIVDRLPEELEFQESSVPVSRPDSQVLLFELRDGLEPGENGELLIKARVKEDTESRGQIVNQAVFSAAELSGPLKAKHRISIEAPELMITKDSNQSSLEVGDIVLFTIRISNDGNGVAKTVRIVDTLPSVLSYVAGSSVMNGESVADPERLGSGGLLWKLDEFGRGEELTLRYQATVVSGAKSGFYTNHAILEAKNSGGQELEAGPAHVRFKVRRRGLKGLADIQGQVFWDRNGNAVRDENEPGVSDIEIVLVREGRQAVTDDEGYFFFPQVKPGEQSVGLDTIRLTEGFHLTTESSVLLSLTERDLGYVEFGLQRDFAELQAIVYFDTNGNGRFDSDERGLPGVEVLLQGKGLYSADRSGMVKLPELEPGVYVLRVFPSSLGPNTRVTGSVTHSVTLTPGEKERIYWQALPIGKTQQDLRIRVFADLNANGYFDADERGLAGVEILLQGGMQSLPASTDESGEILLPEIGPGVYVLRLLPLTLPSLYRAAGSITRSLTLSSGEDLSISWPVLPFDYSPEKLRVRIFIDRNENGRFDEGENGMPGVDVLLQGKREKSMHSTDDSGSIFLSKIRPDVYVLRLFPRSLPSGVRVSGSITRSVTLQPGTKQRIDWRLLTLE